MCKTRDCRQSRDLDPSVDALQVRGNNWKSQQQRKREIWASRKRCFSIDSTWKNVPLFERNQFRNVLFVGLNKASFSKFTLIWRKSCELSREARGRSCRPACIKKTRGTPCCARTMRKPPFTQMPECPFPGQLIHHPHSFVDVAEPART